MELSWLRSSLGPLSIMHSQRSLRPKALLLEQPPLSSASAPTSPPTSCANIRDMIQSSVHPAGFGEPQVREFEPYSPYRSQPLCVFSLITWGRNLTSLITNAITQTRDCANLVTRGFDALWARKIWKCNSCQSLSQHEWPCRSTESVPNGAAKCTYCHTAFLLFTWHLTQDAPNVYWTNQDKSVF